ncbi:hypothetical protein [Caenimonas koreensis]|uniref:Uncharacterized protein n=1 Tax=Caenimonas koreensis DSM 17982 TaxID=1121255 RepID=A0A844B6J2_9BURK|nr:hypothetical protein [Caenimonas koreensis]MRD48803.1 hypothetical protein [Caenimonas koreensis DSM 17982]
MRALIALAFACFVGIAASQPPVPSTFKAAESKDGATDRHQAPSSDVGPSTSQKAPSHVPLASPVPQTPTQQVAASSDEGNKDAKPAHHWWGEADWWVAVFTGLLCVVTAVLALFTYWLWAGAERSGLRQLKMTRHSLNVSRRAADAAAATVAHMQAASAQELRAHVMVDKLALEMIGTKTHIVITVANYGRTPARNVVVSASALVETAAEENTLSVEPQFASVVRPGAIAPTQDHSSIVPLEIADAFEVEGGRLWLFVTGEVTYHDGFTPDRRSTFRYKRTGPNWMREQAMERCQAGNDAN